jgi:hypothetical protein
MAINHSLAESSSYKTKQITTMPPHPEAFAISRTATPRHPYLQNLPKPLSETLTKTLTPVSLSLTHILSELSILSGCSRSFFLFSCSFNMHRLSRRSVSAVLRAGGGGERYRNAVAPIFSSSTPLFDSVRSSVF